MDKKIKQSVSMGAPVHKVYLGPNEYPQTIILEHLTEGYYKVKIPNIQVMTDEGNKTGELIFNTKFNPHSLTFNTYRKNNTLWEFTINEE